MVAFFADFRRFFLQTPLQSSQLGFLKLTFLHSWWIRNLNTLAYSGKKVVLLYRNERKRLNFPDVWWMSDETGIRFSVLHCVSGCYAEVHISWESVVPLTFVCHMVASPARECRLTAKQRLFYLKHSNVCIPYILLHLLQWIRVLVFLGDVAIESGYLMDTTSFDNVFVSGHGRAYSALTAAKVISRASSMLIVSSSSIRICCIRWSTSSCAQRRMAAVVSN